MLPKICSIPECGRTDRIVRGWCRKHYGRWERTGDPMGSAPKASDFKCSIHACDNPGRAKGLCETHYKRQYKHGDPHANFRDRPPSERFFSYVKKTDECWEWQGYINHGGYAQFYFEGQQRPAHRVSFSINVGPIPDGMEIDHICRNRSCVRPSHLRATTPKQNNENRSISSYGESKVRGVTWHKGTQKWRVRVTHNYKSYSVGLFSDLRDAEAAAIAKRNELFTHNDSDRVKKQ